MGSPIGSATRQPRFAAESTAGYRTEDPGASGPLADDQARERAVDTIAAAVDGGLSRGRDVGTIDPERLQGRVHLFDRLSGLAAAGLADTVKALADLGSIGESGASTTADWVKTTTNRSGRAAARVARLATDLADLPATRRALAAGRITDEAADAVVQAARDGRIGSPDQVDATLVDVATTSSPEALRADIRDRQQAADAAAMLHDENRQHARREVRLWREDTGAWRLQGQLPDELGQRVRTVFDAFDHPDPEDATADQRRRPGQRLADALSAMVDTVLDRGLAPATGGITRPHLSVIVHADTVSADLTRPDASDPFDPTAAPATDDPRWADLPGGDLPWGGKLSPQAIRRICCDAAVSRIVMTGDSQVLDVGRATRHWSGPQRRAVNARDRACRGPHCTRPIAWTAVHHLQWWRHDGPTSVDNGLALCHHCHGLVHHHGWTVHLDLATSAATWTAPDGRKVVTTPLRAPAGSGCDLARCSSGCRSASRCGQRPGSWQIGPDWIQHPDPGGEIDRVGTTGRQTARLPTTTRRHPAAHRRWDPATVTPLRTRPATARGSPACPLAP